MKLSDFDYELPESLIALHPPRERSASRLLVVPPEGEPADRRVSDLPGLLRAGDLLVMNDTRVIRARLHCTKAGSGGRVEVLIERVTDSDAAIAQVRASKTPRPGTVLELGAARATVGERVGEFHSLRFSEPVDAVMQREGSLPLPPYIDRPAGHDDLRALPDVVEVHDLHVWTLTSDMDVLTAHLVVRTGSDHHATLDGAREVLAQSHDIHHATLQVEPEDHAGCDELDW